ncbi:MAG: hypothetical protein WCF48_16205, partial [Terriglobales bacterium]
MQERENSLYRQLLAYLVRLRDEKNVWVTAPGNIDRWWRQRSKLKLVQHGDGWRIEGEGSERARVAYASEKEGSLVFTMENSPVDELPQAQYKRS